MDTTSSALSRILHLLAEHPEVQNKLRAELVEAKEENDGRELDYDRLVLLPYLDAVCRETLRVCVSFSSSYCTHTPSPLQNYLTELGNFRYPPLATANRT